MTLDAIFIGSGINALVAAAHMSGKGWRVAVYESADEPGGAVKSGAYTADGYRHDWAAMNLSLFAGSPFFQEHGETLMKHGLQLAPAGNCFASVFPDNSWLGISNDLDVNAARIAEVSEADAETWKALSAEFPERAEVIFAILNSPMATGKLGGLFWRLLRKLGAGRITDLGRMLLSTPRKWLDETFESDKTKAMLAAWGMHLDFAPDIAGGALFPYLEGMANQTFGMALGGGGADTVTKALVAMIEANGGAVQCGSKVTSIITEKKKARAIRLESGEEVTARKAIVANVTPSALAELTEGTGNSDFDSGLSKFEHAPGTLMIHAALDGPLTWSAGEELSGFAYVHVAPSLDQMAKTYAQAKAGLLPDEPVVVVGQPTAVDPSRAPEGKHILWMQVRMVPGEIRGDSAGTIVARDWAEAGDAMADRAIGLVGRYAPDIRERITATRVVTPAELESDNANLVGGDQLGGSHHLTQHFLYRPVRGHADGTTPVKGLYLTGASVWPGAGTGAGSGYLLAKKLAG